MRGKLLLSLLAAGSILAASVLIPVSPGSDTNGFSPLAYSVAVDYFLKIEGVEGESADDRHKGEIDIQSFSWGVSQVGARAGGGGGGAGKATFQDFHFTKRIDKSSPVLFQSVPEGKRYPSCTLTGRKAGEEQEDFFKVKFSDCLITSFQQSGGGDVPMEELSLNFAKIEFEYKPQSADGTYGPPVRGSWDLKKGTK